MTTDHENGLPKQALRATATIHDVDNDKYAVRLEFDRIDGTTGTLTVPRGDANRPTEILRQLGDLGAVFPANANQKQLVKHAMSSDPKTVIKTTKVGGWHAASFMQPHWKVGDADLVWAERGLKQEPSPMGSMRAWRTGLRRPCAKSGLLSFGIGIAFASPLMKLVGEDEGATFNFHGLSSSGKSLTARACQSTFASAAKSDLMTYGLSPRALEEYCFRRNDLVVLLDDEAHLDGKTPQARASDRRRIAFKIAGGSSDGRSEVSVIRSISWRSNGLTSGEEPLGTRGRGEMVRHIDVSVGSHDAGIFRRLDASAGDVKTRGKELADIVEATIATNFAVALPAYVTALMGDLASASTSARELRDRFIAAVGATSSWDRRFASKFGLVFAGMTLAARYGVAPWSEDSVLRTVRSIHRQAKIDIMSDAELADEVVSIVKKAVEADKVITLKKSDNLEGKEIGFIRTVGGSKCVAMSPRHLARATGPARLPAVVKILGERHLVKPGTGNSPYRQLQVQRSGIGERTRWVCFDIGALGIAIKTAA